MYDFSSTVDWLYGLQFFGMKLGLENTRALCAYFGDPQNKYPVIHIAGTNGKGSTSALIMSILREAGLNVALYTSPHLVKFNERIRVNGEKIPEEIVIDYADALRPKVDKLKATFFEATTAIAFRYFAEQKVDVGVIETGMGGRLDSTNVVNPVLSVITSIGLDHTEHLGSTIEAIAKEKAGIIKHRVPLVSGATQDSVKKIFIDTVKRESAPITFAYDAVQIILNDMSLEKMSVDVRGKAHQLKNVASPFIGMHQMENIATAVCAIEHAENILTHKIDDTIITRGIENAVTNSHLRCRFEMLKKDPVVVCDVAHNPPGFERIMETLDVISTEPLVWVVGVMKDKDYHSILQMIAPKCTKLFCVQPEYDRALTSKELQSVATSLGMDAVNAGSVAGGAEKALSYAGGKEKVFIAGSHYVAGEALEYFGEDV
ncbi:MAG TPA: folylpolyglutamate synthase/dihydrofolate synthase family protein [Candidatus Kapabacteria bacterium]|nr:folylpolyglutamate synthase/dihydrofolate synthase family protein [Candidatus Kapabacteria bacterium]